MPKQPLFVLPNATHKPAPPPCCPGFTPDISKEDEKTKQQKLQFFQSFLSFIFVVFPHKAKSSRVPILVKLPHNQMQEQIDIHLQHPREKFQKLRVVELCLE